MVQNWLHNAVQCFTGPAERRQCGQMEFDRLIRVAESTEVRVSLLAQSDRRWQLQVIDDDCQNLLWEMEFWRCHMHRAVPTCRCFCTGQAVNLFLGSLFGSHKLDE